MSADDGIYILRTLGKDGIIAYEYRVSHLQAVENVSWDIIKGDYTEDQDVMIANAREMWNSYPVFQNDIDALAEAKRLHDEITDEIGYTEYGICYIYIERQF